jgi:hypothetical protein
VEEPLARDNSKLGCFLREQFIVNKPTLGVALERNLLGGQGNQYLLDSDTYIRGRRLELLAQATATILSRGYTDTMFRRYLQRFALHFLWWGYTLRLASENVVTMWEATVKPILSVAQVKGCDEFLNREYMVAQRYFNCLPSLRTKQLCSNLINNIDPLYRVHLRRLDELKKLLRLRRSLDRRTCDHRALWLHIENILRSAVLIEDVSFGIDIVEDVIDVLEGAHRLYRSNPAAQDTIVYLMELVVQYTQRHRPCLLYS